MDVEIVQGLEVIFMIFTLGEIGSWRTSHIERFYLYLTNIENRLKVAKRI